MNTYRVFVIIQTDRELTTDEAQHAVHTALASGLYSAGIPFGYIRTASVPSPVLMVSETETELV